MRKILIAVIIVLSVLLIYLGFKDEEIYYFSIGDYLSNGITPYGNNDYGYSDYIKDYISDNDKLETYVNYSKKNLRTIDLIKDIEDNVKIEVDSKSKTIQNGLIKADLVTLSIGMNDLLDNVKFDNDFSINDLYDKLEEVLVDYEKLFEILREYCKEEIVLIGLYNSLGNESLNEFFEYANQKLYNLSSSYDIKYVNIYDDFKNSEYFDNSRIYPNKLGYELISNKIINLLNQKISS